MVAGMEIKEEGQREAFWGRTQPFDAEAWNPWWFASKLLGTADPAPGLTRNIPQLPGGENRTISASFSTGTLPGPIMLKVGFRWGKYKEVGQKHKISAGNGIEMSPVTRSRSHGWLTSRLSLLITKIGRSETSPTEKVSKRSETERAIDLCANEQSVADRPY
jgi:hypothetical protein